MSYILIKCILLCCSFAIKKGSVLFIVFVLLGHIYAFSPALVCVASLYYLIISLKWRRFSMDPLNLNNVTQNTCQSEIEIKLTGGKSCFKLLCLYNFISWSSFHEAKGEKLHVTFCCPSLKLTLM